MSARPALFLLLPAACVGAVSAVAAREDEPAPAPGEGTLVTLRAWDDLTATLDFETGSSGTYVDGGRLVREDADIVFQQDGTLAFSTRFRERARLVDCDDFGITPAGTARGFAPAAPMSVLHSLFLAGGKLNYVGASGEAGTFGGAKMLFGTFPPEGLQTLEPRLGHVYLLRYKAQDTPQREGQLVAFRVVAYDPAAGTLDLRYRLLN